MLYHVAPYPGLTLFSLLSSQANPAPLGRRCAASRSFVHFDGILAAVGYLHAARDGAPEPQGGEPAWAWDATQRMRPSDASWSTAGQHPEWLWRPHPEGGGSSSPTP